jgi:peptide-methionine (S)-S-oxide reductase
MTSGASREQALSTVVFGMGCFWAPQEAFESIAGVESARVGYASVAPQSSTESPSYFAVCQGNGYTEAVEVTFNENLVLGLGLGLGLG